MCDSIEFGMNFENSFVLLRSIVFMIHMSVHVHGFKIFQREH